MLRIMVLLAALALFAGRAEAQSGCLYNSNLPTRADGASGFQLCDSAGRHIVTPGPLTYSGSTSASVGTTSGTLAAAGTYKRALNVCTLPTSTTNVWLRADAGTAAVGVGLPVYAGGGCVSFGSLALPMPTADITAITDSGSAQTVTLAGG